MQVGMIGLGRMGANMVRRLMRGGHECVAHDVTAAAVKSIAAEGARGAATLDEFVAALQKPRTIWLMVPAAVVDSTLDALLPKLEPGDVVVDGGNSYYRDDIARAARLTAKGVHYVDCGTSGGVLGLDRGYCLMIGGEPDVVKRLDPLFATLAPGAGSIARTPGREKLGGSSERGYLHCGPSGAGHFVKMVHNGIEYGMMAAYAEGLNILRHANIGKQKHESDAETTPLRNPEFYQYDFNLADVTEVWRRGSVVASWLLDLTAAALAADPSLEKFAGRVSDSGEGRWTIDAAIDEAVPAHVLTAALLERFSSRGEADFQNRVLSAMRFEFGGHVEKGAWTATRADALVFFGATGDLARKKVYAALLALTRHGRLDMPIIGIAHSDWSLELLQNRIRDELKQRPGFDPAALETLLSHLTYLQGDYVDPETYTALRTALGAAKHPLHYLAIPPDAFATVADGLGRSGCAQGARIVVEKPFGRDLASAIALNETLHREFDESSIYRIDHFLGKEAVQNLLVFRFANTILESVWNSQHVESVQILMAESFGVEGRGRFYEEAGTIRDVIQNHLLLVLGMLTMEAPVAINAAAVNDAQLALFKSIRPLSPSDVVRGQCRSYHDEKDVAPDSTVETYAAVRLGIDSPRWKGVPFLIRAGKYLTATVCEVIVTFKQPVLFSDGAPSNYVRFRLSPDVLITIGARVKRAGEAMLTDPADFTLVHHPDGDEMDAYERLLGDAIDGDSMLFAREDCVEAAWRIVEPVLGDVTPVHSYEHASWGPLEAGSLAGDVGGWRTPSA